MHIYKCLLLEKIFDANGNEFLIRGINSANADWGNLPYSLKLKSLFSLMKSFLFKITTTEISHTIQFRPLLPQVPTQSEYNGESIYKVVLQTQTLITLFKELYLISSFRSFNYTMLLAQKINGCWRDALPGLKITNGYWTNILNI